MKDVLQRFLFEHAPVRGEIVHLDATWRAVLEQHDYPPVLRAVLGEMMAAAALLAATLKFDGTLIMQIQGNGPVRLLVVECTSRHHMRATAKWSGTLGPAGAEHRGQETAADAVPELPFARSDSELIAAGLRDLVGDGKFAITLVSDDDGQNYQGVVELEGASVAQILEHYMRTSEQLETRLWLACNGGSAAGLLLQKLPQREGADTDAWQRALHLAATLARHELLELPAPHLLHRLYHEEDIRVFASRPVSFRCSCTRDRVTSMLRMLGHDEVKSILNERGAIDVNCEFCNRRYQFDSVDAEQVFAAEHPLQAGATRH